MDGAQRSQTCKPMNKNRIEGRHGTTSWHNTAKSSGLPVEVNAAVVQGSIVQLPGEWERSGHGGPDCLLQHALKSHPRKRLRSQQRP
jgi:hypothetical protein